MHPSIPESPTCCGALVSHSCCFATLGADACVCLRTALLHTPVLLFKGILVLVVLILAWKSTICAAYQNASHSVFTGDFDDHVAYREA